MVEAGPWIFWFNAAILVAAVCLTVISGYIASKSLQELPKATDNRDEKYSDEDGEASENTQKAFSVNWQNWLLSIVVVAGFIFALVEGIVATTHGWKKSTSLWMEFGIWVRQYDAGRCVEQWC